MRILLLDLRLWQVNSRYIFFRYTDVMEHLLPFRVGCIISQNPDYIFVFKCQAVVFAVHEMRELVSGHDVFGDRVARVDIVDDQEGGGAPCPEVGVFLLDVFVGEGEEGVEFHGGGV